MFVCNQRQLTPSDECLPGANKYWQIKRTVGLVIQNTQEKSNWETVVCGKLQKIKYSSN